MLVRTTAAARVALVFLLEFHVCPKHVELELDGIERLGANGCAVAENPQGRAIWPIPAAESPVCAGED
jgi:hypothetical protein